MKRHGCRFCRVSLEEEKKKGGKAMQQLFQQIFELLSNAGLLTGVTEEQIREARADADNYSLMSALARLLYSEEQAWPRRFVFYDAECLYTNDDLIRLVCKFVAATDGEWTPQNIQADWDGFQANISFDFHGQHIHWTFSQESDWVYPEFYERLEEFTQQHLSGTFVNIPTRDQNACHIYLPKNIAEEVESLIFWWVRS